MHSNSLRAESRYFYGVLLLNIGFLPAILEVYALDPRAPTKVFRRPFENNV
jgi:hypothetical protein